jgi:hypothetical protein
MAPLYDITSIGRRLLPHIIDERAKTGYERPYALYPRTKDPADGLKAISYARLANAINRASWWLEKELPRAEEKQHAFAYLGANDLRYVVFVLATIKTGRKVGFIHEHPRMWESVTDWFRSLLPLFETQLMLKYRCLSESAAKLWFLVPPWRKIWRHFLQRHKPFARSKRLVLKIF